MKNCKHTFLISLIFCSLLGYAGGVEPSLLPGKEMNGKAEHTLTSANFALMKKRYAPAQVTALPVMQTSLNAGYVTGNKKVNESKVSSILKWDLRVKFRLSSSMNIIFSYN